MKLEQIKSVILEIASKREEVLVIYIYGSFLNTKYYNDIDIGILIKADFKPDLFYEARIARALEKKLHIEIDLRVLNRMPLRLLFSVLYSSKVLFCRDEQTRIEFEEKVTKEYIDLKYHHDIYNEMRSVKYAFR